MVFSGDDTSFAGVMTALENVFAGAIRRKISMEEILSAIPGTLDISKEEQLLSALEELDTKGQIRLPSRKGRGWQKFGILPLYVTLVRANEDRASRARKRTLARIREQSPWEPTQMAAFAHTLTTEKQLTRARADHPLGGGFFAAVVFGKGFKATRATPIQSLDSLANIENQTCAGRVHYYHEYKKG